MYKEIIIIIGVITIIILADIITNNYTKNSIDMLTSDLVILRKDILNEDKNKSIKQMEKVKSNWENRYNVLVYYIEHDELEKVETELTGLSADLGVEEYKHCISQLDTTIFILEHICDKEKFSIQSIF